MAKVLEVLEKYNYWAAARSATDSHWTRINVSFWKVARGRHPTPFLLFIEFGKGKIQFLQRFRNGYPAFEKLLRFFARLYSAGVSRTDILQPKAWAFFTLYGLEEIPGLAMSTIISL